MAKSAKTSETQVLKPKNKKFDIKDFKKSKNLLQTADFKKQEWLELSDAFNKSISLPGIPLGHITIIRGHSDTGKTLAMIEAGIAAQKAGKLPILIITEMKWSWEHAKTMGFDVTATVNEKEGTVSYDGNFIYIDRSSLTTIEDVAAFIADLFNEQKRGNLPVDLVFLWDSVGSIPSLQSVESGKNNAMWNAGAMATQFGNFINQMFTMSRKSHSEYTNTFIVINKARVEYPVGNPMEKPKMKCKGGDSMYFDCTLCITLGNITNAGTSKIEATKNGKKITFAKRTKVSVDKNHITNSTTTSRVIMTEYGFIEDTPKALEAYKKEHRDEWLNILGSTDFIVEEEGEIRESTREEIDPSMLEED